MADRGESNEIGTIIDDTPVRTFGKIRIWKRHARLRKGEDLTRYFINRKDDLYVVIFALTDDGKIVLTREPKYAIWDRVTGAPCGHVDERDWVGEGSEIEKRNRALIEAAKRELLEETGYVSKNWEVVGDPLYGFADMIDGGAHYFVVAPCCSRPVQNPEIYNDVVLVDVKEVDLLLAGEHPEVKIKLLTTQAGLSRGREYLSRQKSQSA